MPCNRDVTLALTDNEFRLIHNGLCCARRVALDQIDYFRAADRPLDEALARDWLIELNVLLDKVSKKWSTDNAD